MTTNVNDAVRVILHQAIGRALNIPANRTVEHYVPELFKQWREKLDNPAGPLQAAVYYKMSLLGFECEP